MFIVFLFPYFNAQLLDSVQYRNIVLYLWSTRTMYSYCRTCTVREFIRNVTVHYGILVQYIVHYLYILRFKERGKAVVNS